MRNVVFLVAFISSIVSSAGAAQLAPLPRPPVGEWRFSGTYLEIQFQATERVYIASDAGRTRLGELLARGYTCGSITSGWRLCKHIERELPPVVAKKIPADVLRKVREQIGEGAIHFQGSPSRIELSSEAPALTVFHVIQPVEVNRVRISEYDYFRLTPSNGESLDKIRIREDLWLLPSADGRFVDLPITLHYESGYRGWRAFVAGRFVRRGPSHKSPDAHPRTTPGQ